MKKWIWVIVVVILVVLVFVFRSDKKLVNNENQIKVGVIAPLSGFLAEFGEATKNGILLAEKESGTSNVEFIFEDSAYDPKKAISAYNKLATIDKVDVIVDWGSATTEAVAPLVKNYPNISFISISAAIGAPAKDSKIIRFFDRPEAYAAKTWEHLRKLGYKNIAIIKTQNQWLNSVYQQQVMQAKPDETVTLIDDVASFDQMDFRTSISKIKNAKKPYDAVGIYMLSGQIGQFYKQSKELGLKTKTFGTDFFESQSDIDVAGDAINGSFYAQYDISDKFKKTYFETYKNLSQVVYAGIAYDLTKIFINGNFSSGEDAINQLKKINGYEGILGKYFYRYNDSDKDSYMAIPIHIKSVNNGAIETLY